MLRAKNRQRLTDETSRPLESYRRQELERMQLNLFGFNSSYHVARYNFVHKRPRSRTLLYLATLRARMAPAMGAVGPLSQRLGLP